MENTFIEVGHYQLCKYNMHAEGDVFLSQKNSKDGRVITALSDGLGSGIKAGVLATLTATMATRFIAADIPIKRAAEIIMNEMIDCMPMNNPDNDRPVFVLLVTPCFKVVNTAAMLHVTEINIIIIISIFQIRRLRHKVIK